MSSCCFLALSLPNIHFFLFIKMLPWPPIFCIQHGYPLLSPDISFVSLDTLSFFRYFNFLITLCRCFLPFLIAQTNPFLYILEAIFMPCSFFHCHQYFTLPCVSFFLALFVPFPFEYCNPTLLLRMWLMYYIYFFCFSTFILHACFLERTMKGLFSSIVCPF